MIVTGDTVSNQFPIMNLLENFTPEQLKELNAVRWRLTLLEMLSSMFVRDGFDEFVETRAIEPLLITSGCTAYVKQGDKFVYGRCVLGGKPYTDYVGSLATVTAGGGFCKQYEDWRNNENIVVAFNTPLMLPDLQIIPTAADLNEIDISLMCNVLYTRLYPIAAAHDDKTLELIQKLFNDMTVGKLNAITSDNLIEREANGYPAFDMLNLTDVSLSDKIQYIAKYHDDKMRWFWSIYGQNVQATSKLAQETEKEASSGEGVSMIMPHTMYHERQREVKALKDKFGWTVTIEFSEPWQNAFADCKSEDDTAATAEKGTTDESNNDSGSATGESEPSGEE